MISLIHYLAGNAALISLSPPDGATRWRVLRNLTGVFADENAPALLYEGYSTQLVDNGLANGQTVYYQPFYWDGWAWTGGNVASITPLLGFAPKTPDPLLLVHDRLSKGLLALFYAGLLGVPHPVPVLLSSPPLEPGVLPLVTVHVASDAVANQFVGGLDDGDTDRSGWLAKMSVQAVAHCINGDERALLRRAVRSVLMADTDFYADCGFMEITVDQSDHEDFESYNTPLYQAQSVLSFLYEEHLALPATPALVGVTVIPSVEEPHAEIEAIDVARNKTLSAKATVEPLAGNAPKEAAEAIGPPQPPPITLNDFLSTLNAAPALKTLFADQCRNKGLVLAPPDVWAARFRQFAHTPIPIKE